MDATLTISLAGKEGTVTFRQVSGAAGNIHVMFNRYFHGQFVPNNARWVAYLSENSELRSVEPTLTNFVRNTFQPP